MDFPRDNDGSRRPPNGRYGGTTPTFHEVLKKKKSSRFQVVALAVTAVILFLGARYYINTAASAPSDLINVSGDDGDGDLVYGIPRRPDGHGSGGLRPGGVVVDEVLGGDVIDTTAAAERYARIQRQANIMCPQVRSLITYVPYCQTLSCFHCTNHSCACCLFCDATPTIDIRPRVRLQRHHVLQRL